MPSAGLLPGSGKYSMLTMAADSSTCRCYFFLGYPLQNCNNCIFCAFELIFKCKTFLAILAKNTFILLY